jgi:uncharacterized protein (TIGR02594 family)
MSFWENLLDIFKSFLASLSQKQADGPVLIKPAEVKSERNFTINERALVMASQEIGVKEVAGTASNPRIVRYHAYARVDNDITKGESDSVAWCSSFVCFVMEMIGRTSTNSMAARSWLKWGRSFKSAPLPGDIVVFWRVSPTSWQGHVGFYVAEDATHILVLGGNQSNAVNVRRYAKSQLLDIRRSSQHEPITQEVRENLARIAHTIRTQGTSDLFGNHVG